MSSRIKRNYEFLSELVKDSPELKNLVESATADNIDAITELAINVLKGNIDLNQDLKLKLKKHRSIIRKLSNKDISYSTKKTLMIKKIKILPIIITPLLSAIGSLVGKVVANQFGL